MSTLAPSGRSARDGRRHRTASRCRTIDTPASPSWLEDCGRHSSSVVSVTPAGRHDYRSRSCGPDDLLAGHRRRLGMPGASSPRGDAGEAAAQRGAAHRPASAVRVRVGIPITTAARRRERAHPEALEPATWIELDQTRTWSCTVRDPDHHETADARLSEVRCRGFGWLMRRWRAPSSRRPSR